MAKVLHRSRLWLVFAGLIVTGGCAEPTADKPDMGSAAHTSVDERAVASGSCDELEGFDAILCKDPEVQELDQEMNTLLSRLKATASHEHGADIRAEQADWARQRDACVGLAEPKRRACIDAAYHQRMQAIRQQTTP